LKNSEGETGVAKRGLLEWLYHSLWLLCLLVESVSAYSHWNRRSGLAAELLSAPYGDWVRLAGVVATLSLPVLTCILIARIRNFKWVRAWEVALALIVIPMFLYNLSFGRS